VYVGVCECVRCVRACICECKPYMQNELGIFGLIIFFICLFLLSYGIGITYVCANAWDVYVRAFIYECKSYMQNELEIFDLVIFLICLFLFIIWYRYHIGVDECMGCVHVCLYECKPYMQNELEIFGLVIFLICLFLFIIWYKYHVGVCECVGCVRACIYECKPYIQNELIRNFWFSNFSYMFTFVYHMV